MKTVAIIGAGPIGIAAAHGCLARGHTPLVLEKGDAPGDSLRRWGPTRFFSPLSMNLPPMLLEMALHAGGARPDALLTGPEFAELLSELARAPALAPHVKCRHAVRAVTRRNLARGDLAGHPVRAELPFTVVAGAPEGDVAFEVDAVLDASGVYDTPVPVVARGAGALDGRAIRHLGDLHSRARSLANTRVLVVGHGHSAANGLCALEAVAREAPDTRVTWAVRSRNLRPLEAAASDPLPERDFIVTRANELAAKPPAWLRIERSASIESVASRGPAFTVALGGGRSIDVDHVVALLGYRPDLAPLSELAIEVSPATEGAMRLAGALANVTDCLSVPKVAPRDLASGEPRFHLVGAKSYGRAATFLLQTGYSQLETILDGLFAVA